MAAWHIQRKLSQLSTYYVSGRVLGPLLMPGKKNLLNFHSYGLVLEASIQEPV